ncbi:MAG: hypothetical protein GF401_17520, partial [Chitinivibrionales bacterium]|nr:hypothetical protein [Chitinivibrionales bacterium]
MKHSILCIGMLCGMVAGQSVNLTGTIVNQHEFPVESLTVSLLEADLTERTDENGEFHILEATFASGIPGTHQSMPSIEDGLITFSVNASGQPVSIELFEMNGAKATTVVNREFGSGSHRIPLNENLFRSSSSMKILVLKKGAEMYRFKLMQLGRGIHPVAELVSTHSQSLAQQASGQALDRLEIRRNGEIEVVIDIDNLVDDLQ